MGAIYVMQKYHPRDGKSSLQVSGNLISNELVTPALENLERKQSKILRRER